MKACALLGLLGIRGLLAPSAQAADWPQWRGPQGDGISLETGWRSTFPLAGPPKLWETKLGQGHSSVTVNKDRLVTLCCEETTNRESIRCLDTRTGKTLWKHTYALESVQRGKNPPGGTPTLAGGVVFAYGAAMNLHALDIETGKVLWARDLMKELPGTPSSYGFQISPVLFEDLVILPALTATAKEPKGPNGPAPKAQVEPRGGPYPPTGGILLALHRKTGKEVWRNTDGASPWSTPVIATLEGQPTLVHLTGKRILALDPKTGKTRWNYNPSEAELRALDVAAAPLISKDHVVAPIHNGPGARPPRGACTICLRVRAGKPELVWQSTEWTHWFQSGVIWQDHVYGFDERSNFFCLELTTGKTKWRSRELGMTGSNGGGFMLSDGKILAIDARGKLTIAAVSPMGAKVLAQAPVLDMQGGFQCETAPVLVDGLLYCRNHNQLLCLDLRKKD